MPDGKILIINRWIVEINEFVVSIYDYADKQNIKKKNWLLCASVKWPPWVILRRCEESKKKQKELKMNKKKEEEEGEN